ncbi:sensor histidine kinase [uncultured Dysosmobacter sp.]|uniref:sensor histidine kinase n=1 Tax=uncultured Dysosmobacter sp. TaxID=2591384 RepID=UPI0026390036|nr:GHKL domain-containing protein [uncultured Dysosmobacter sp.]
MGIKVLLIVLVYMVFCAVFYGADWKQCIFFSGLNYSLLFLADLFSVLAENILTAKDEAYAFKYTFLALTTKLVWVLLLFMLRRIWKGKNSYGELSHKEWRKFGMVPLFTLASMLLMYFCYSGEKKVQAVYLFIAAGLIMINFLVMVLMRDILMKGELLRESALTDQKKESQLAHYRDMQAVYERQGRKMHDYKNQIRTMQVLLKEGDVQAAAGLAERLTESISVEMSAVNTNHPVVNAVLNQKFHAAREQGVSMIFKVGDMSGMRLDGEEIVILLSNLLDNAIHECVKVVKAGRKAVINIKLVQEGGKMIFSVKNPVAEKVQATDGIVLDSSEGMHGIGLMNVKAVVDKYGGDFAVFCDGEKFQAVVMI